LRAARPDLRLHALSGNVDTRLRKLDEGQSDSLVLAVAGLSRLGRRDRIDQVLPLDVVVPAPGQGALALQVRADDDRIRDVVAALDDLPTRVAVQAERAFLAATGGGCRSPIGALGEVAAENLTIHVAAARELCLPDGATVSGGVLRLTEQGPVEDWRRLAESLAERVVAMRTRARVIVTRPLNSATALIEALRGAGFDALPVPTIEIRDEPDGAAPAAIVAAARAGSRIVTTSPNGVRAALAALDRSVVSPHTVSWAVVGKASEAILLARGASAFVPSRPLGAALAAELPVGFDDPVLVVRGDLADSGVIDVLRQRGATVSDVIAYRTVEAPVGSRPMLAAALDGPIDVITFASGSAVRGLIGLASFGARSMVRSVPAVCIGPSTAAVARENGFKTVVETDDPGAEALVRAVARALAPGPANFAPSELQTPISSGVST
jgi:uroporphyrinogen-III synthase